MDVGNDGPLCALFAPEHQPLKLEDELGRDCHDCFLRNIPMEPIADCYPGSLREPFELNKFDFLSRTM